MKWIRILALGDSYTIGTGVLESERWPIQLANALREKGFRVSEPSIIAHTGWTTGDVLAAIEKSQVKQLFDLVTLLIGVNNQYRGLDPEEYRLEFDLLLDKAIAFSGGNPANVIVLSIPDWGVTPFAEGRDGEQIAREIDLFNRINRQLSTEAGVQYIDITPLSRLDEQDATLLASDGLHPSGKMYLIWVERLLPIALRILSRE